MKNSKVRNWILAVGAFLLTETSAGNAAVCARSLADTDPRGLGSLGSGDKTEPPSDGGVDPLQQDRERLALRTAMPLLLHLYQGVREGRVTNLTSLEALKFFTVRNSVNIAKCIKILKAGEYIVTEPSKIDRRSLIYLPTPKLMAFVEADLAPSADPTSR